MVIGSVGYGPYPACAKEAFHLLNCTIGEGYDQEKCLRFLAELRKCVMDKRVKKFVLEENDPDDLPVGKGKQ